MCQFVKICKSGSVAYQKFAKLATRLLNFLITPNLYTKKLY